MSIEGKKNSWVVKNFHKKRNYTIRSGSYFLVVCCRSESGAGRHFVALCSPGQWVLGRLPKLVPQPGQEQGPSCSLSGDIQTYILGKGMNSISFCWLVYALYMYKKHVIKYVPFTCTILHIFSLLDIRWSMQCSPLDIL